MRQTKLPKDVSTFLTKFRPSQLIGPSHAAEQHEDLRDPPQNPAQPEKPWSHLDHPMLQNKIKCVTLNLTSFSIG